VCVGKKKCTALQTRTRARPAARRLLILLGIPVYI